MSDRSQYALKKPDAILFQRNNSILPFEDASSLEFFSNKNDWSVPHPPSPTRPPAPAFSHRPVWGLRSHSGLFLLGSHNKKRPDNIVLGRFFDHHLLDMIEVGVDHYVPMTDFKVPPDLEHRWAGHETWGGA